MAEEPAPDLQSLLEIPGLRDMLLTCFHPRRLEDIQGVVSLWSMGLWRDDAVREHFLDGLCGRNGQFLSRDMCILKQQQLVRDAIDLYNYWDDLRGLSEEDLWDRYQFLSVIPRRTCRFVMEGLTHRKTVMDIIMSGNVNELTKEESRTCLVSASRCGMIDVFASILNCGKLPVGDRSFDDACIWAARNGLTDIIDLLITKGKANVEATDEDGMTVLMLAATTGYADLVDLLITKGNSNVEAIDEYGRTALLWAARIGHTDIVDLLITKGNANVEDIDPFGKTALIWAATNAYAKVVNLLITKHNANVEATDAEGKTALICAAEFGRTKVVNLLITRYNANVEATDNAGRTALRYATKSGHDDIVNLLANHGSA